MKNSFFKIVFGVALASLLGCVSEYDLFEETNNENQSDTSTSSECDPRANTVYHNTTRIVYDDIFYLSFPYYLASGKKLKGQDNQTGSQLVMEFNSPLVTGDYIVADHTITGSIQNNEVVLYGGFPVGTLSYHFFAEPGTIINIEQLNNGKWSGSGCDVKFTIPPSSGRTDNFTTDVNLTQTY